MTREYCEELTGTTVSGYELRSLVECTPSAAVYLTTHGEGLAVLKLEPAGSGVRPVPPLENDHILRVLASDECEVEGTKFRYFVTEAADENLGAVIASRPLSVDEAMETVKPVLQALVYLHGRGLTHGDLKPANIFAKGDTIKISADSIGRETPELSPENDMTALGSTVLEVLTQGRETTAIANLPQPFRDIVEHTLQAAPAARWTARQAAMRLSGAMPTAVATAIAAPVKWETPPAEPTEKKPLPRWLLPAAVAVMVLAVLFVFARGTSSPSSSSMAASNPPAPVMHSVTPPVPAPLPPPKSSPFEAAPKPAVSAPPVAPATPGKKVEGHGWFVVVASYSREADANSEATLLGHRFPTFKPRVFPPSAIDTHYLVIIGSGLSEDSAQSLLQRAISSGLPPDSYIKKYPK